MNKFVGTGYNLVAGTSAYSHRFGGSSWKTSDDSANCKGPTLISVIDLNDPLMPRFQTSLLEIPLVSHIDCDIWSEKQVFQLDPRCFTARLISRDLVESDWVNQESLPNPLPESACTLERQTLTSDEPDDPANETAIEEFLTGDKFIRVLGPPLWLLDSESPLCSNGHESVYFASIGAERWGSNGQFLDGVPFYIGEGALYFFVCFKCNQEIVLSQCT